MILERYYTPLATWGYLLVEDREFWTIEPPWLENKQSESCIPEGEYYLELRDSPIVNRTSGGDYEEGWEVADVPNREYIMFHVGNWQSDSRGCILVGSNLGIADNRLFVSNSRRAFAEFMELTLPRDHWKLEIKQWSP